MEYHRSRLGLFISDAVHRSAVAVTLVGGVAVLCASSSEREHIGVAVISVLVAILLLQDGSSTDLLLFSVLVNTAVMTTTAINSHNGGSDTGLASQVSAAVIMTVALVEALCYFS